LPLMIAYLKREETSHGTLHASLQYVDARDSNTIEHYKPETRKLVEGTFYTIDELIRAMIEGSDNNAAILLSSYLNQNSLQDIFSDIGLKVTFPDNGDSTKDFISAKTYAYIFRVLYNSTYLSREMSEKALQYLSQADFPEGIVGGVPKGIITAQKFGERTILSPKGAVVDHELHNCGIVYYPKHPYLLCIMTKGADFDLLSGAIRSISKLIYSEVDKKYGPAK